MPTNMAAKLWHTCKHQQYIFSHLLGLMKSCEMPMLSLTCWPSCYSRPALERTCRSEIYPLPWASGLPVAIQWQSSVPGTQTPVYTGMPLEKELLVASVFPVCFQWSSSGFPVVFQCVPSMQINTGSPLGYHWVLASASVGPVASQCTCGSSGLPVCSNYAN